MLMCFTTYVYAQGPPVLASENGTVSVFNCSGLVITNTSIPNPAIIEWWYDADNNLATANTLEHVGGTTYTPLNIGYYYVTFPWHPSNSNTIESVAHTPLSIMQYPAGNITNSQTSIGCSSFVPGELNPSYMTGVDYQNPVWNRDGNLMETDYQILELWRPGLYTLNVDGPCGAESVTHSVNFECSNDILSTSCTYSRVYEFGGTLNNSSIFTDAIIGQTLTVIGNCIIGGHMKMEQDAIIIVTPGSTLELDGAVFTSCGTWKGLVVDGGTLIFTGLPSANLPAKIYDAEVGITILNSPTKFTVEKAEFEDNGVHIAAKNSNFDIVECEFNSLKDIPNNNTYASFLTNKQTSNPMFYAEGSTISHMDSVLFDQRDDNLIGTPNTTTAIELNNTGFGANARIKILDNFVNGIYAYDCDSLHIKGTKFGSPYINTYLDYSLNQPLSENGLILTNCTNTYLDSVTLMPQNTGIQFYLNQTNFPTGTGPGGPLGPVQNINSTFIDLTIDMQGGGLHETGIIIAPEVNPLSNTDPSLNTNTIPIRLDIACSRISNCKYGIVGSGVKTDWVMPRPNNTVPVGNYDPSIEFTNNSEWNIVWSENVGWNSSNGMNYYTANPYSTPLIEDNNGPSFPLLDGHITEYNNYTNKPLKYGPFVSPQVATGVYCQSNWQSYKREPATVDRIKQELKINAYPNPFTDNLSIDLGDNEDYYVYIINVFGTKITERLKARESLSINTKEWATGLYFIHLSSDNREQTFRAVKQ